MVERLTPRQLKVLDFIRQHIDRRRYAPTLEEIAARFGVIKPTVQQYLRTLQEKGFIRRKRYAHRSIELVEEKDASGRTYRLPLLGLIAAGSPIEAIENREVVEVASLLGLEGTGERFVLEVRGDSMIEDGIFDGDYVVVERREVARDGETVVALLPDGGATLKRFYREGKRVRLQPANPRLKPLYVDEVRIQGVVKGVVRSLG